MSTGRGPHDQRDLRDDAGRLNVPVEDLAVQPQADHTLLDAGAASFVDPDDRAAVPQGEIEYLDDLLAVNLA